jgi:lipopolysaccharide biosynthesis glycosyltransferase
VGSKPHAIRKALWPGRLDGKPESVLGMSNQHWYVGCACDRNFVQHTAVMLTSLNLNGGIPDATILIAGFDLTRQDYTTLRSAAGEFGRDVRFVEVTREMLGAVADREWEGHYSLPIFGRLFLPELITSPGARLLTLDSDMIVNRPVRPLFELNLLGSYVGAIHDTPRIDDLDYFNSGMMIIDVDGFHKYDVAKRCLSWLAEQEHRPKWPDQDALNHIVGHKWIRLDRTWNLAFCGGDFDPERITPAYYENANIAHFTGQTKPWNDFGHVGRPLYERYLAELQWHRRLYNAAAKVADTNFVVTAFQLFLGRDPSSVEEVAGYKSLRALEVVRTILQSEEFLAGTFVSLKLNAAFPAGRFENEPSLRHSGWAVERLPLRRPGIIKAEEALGWRSLLSHLLNDDFFCDAFGLVPMLAMMNVVKNG